MKKSLFLGLFVGALSLGLSSFITRPAEEYSVDVSASQLKWTGYHLAKSYAHWGHVNLKSGSLTLDGNRIATAEFVIDMTTLASKDIEDAKDRAKLDGHLKSDDFF